MDMLLLSRFSRVQPCVTPQTAAHQAPPSLGFSRQEYWSGVPIPSPCIVLLLSHFSRVQLCATPQTAAHQAPPSLGFSKQEHQSGLPWPSPMHESEKGKGSCSVVFVFEHFITSSLQFLACIIISPFLEKYKTLQIPLIRTLVIILGPFR